MELKWGRQEYIYNHGGESYWNMGTGENGERGG
jgi:hypothetical protein